MYFLIVTSFIGLIWLCYARPKPFRPKHRNVEPIITPLLSPSTDDTSDDVRSDHVTPRILNFEPQPIQEEVPSPTEALFSEWEYIS